MQIPYTPAQIIKKLESLKSDKAQWNTHYQEIADYICPVKNDFVGKRISGEKKGLVLVDNTGVMCNELLAGALHSMLTSPSEQFFMLTTGDEDIDDEDDVRKWLQRTSKKIRNVLNNSNFQTETHEIYIDQGAFGTSHLTIEEDDNLVCRFSARPLQQTLLVEDHNGTVVEVYRCWSYTAEKAVLEFGLENMPEKIQDAYQKGHDQVFEFVHCVYENNTFGTKDSKFRFPWISQYINVEYKKEVKRAGFYEKPAITPRWSKRTGEVYGRSPGMTALPEVKILNLMTETTMRGAQKVVDPPLQMPDDGFVMPLVTRPAGINYYRAGTQDFVKPIFNDARIDFGFEAMQYKTKKVREAFYVDQLRLEQGGPQKTATEVQQLTEDSMRFLAPMLARQKEEYLSPVIERVMGIMDRRRMFDPLPRRLAQMQKDGQKLDVRYSSLVALSQRINDVNNIMRTLQAVEPFINLDQSVADNFDGDRITKIIARSHNYPQEGLRDAKAIEGIRSARAKAQQEMISAQQEQMQMQNAATAAQAVGSVQKKG